MAGPGHPIECLAVLVKGPGKCTAACSAGTVVAGRRVLPAVRRSNAEATTAQGSNNSALYPRHSVQPEPAAHASATSAVLAILESYLIELGMLCSLGPGTLDSVLLGPSARAYRRPSGKHALALAIHPA